MYANYAGMTPIAAPVEEAMHATVVELATRGVGAIGTAIARREAARAKVAALVGVTAEEIGFVTNTTSGIRALALGIPWRRGDRVVIFAREFPANVTPWQRAADVFDLRLERLPIAPWHDDVPRGLAELEAVLRTGVRAVAVSAVQFQTGLRMPLAAISQLCRRWGALLVVDAIQAVGVVPLDMPALGIDALACGGHKWLGGVTGCGFVAIRADVAVRLRPLVAGWTSHGDPFGFLLRGPGLLRADAPIRARADMVEDGAFALAASAALDAAVDLLAQLGIPEIYGHVQRWHDLLEPVLVELGFKSLRAADPEARSGILSFRAPNGLNIVGLHERLGASGIGCAIPDGVLRFSPHWSNSPAEHAQIADALALALRPQS